jgi:hypothetical protein
MRARGTQRTGVSYNSVMLLSGVDLDKQTLDELPTRHLPLRTAIRVNQSQGSSNPPT